jgi:hypothetical protein
MNTRQVAFAGVVRMVELAATSANKAARIAEDKRLKAVLDAKRESKARRRVGRRNARHQVPHA